MFKLVVFCALASLAASKPSTLITSGSSSSITTEEKTEIRHHLPLTQVRLESTPILKTAEILTPTAEIVRPAAVSHEFRSEIHKPIFRTAEFIGPSAEIVRPYVNLVPGAVSHQFRSDLHSAPLLKTTEILSPIKHQEIVEARPLLELKSAPSVSHSTKTEIIGEPLIKSIVSQPVIQKTEIVEQAPILKKSEISHSYVESTQRDYIGAPHAVIGYSPLSNVAITPYARVGAEPLVIPSIGATQYLVHQPLRYL